METEALIGILGFAGLIITALAGALWRQSDHTAIGNPHEGEEPRDYMNARMGDLATGMWIREFDRIHVRMAEMERKLDSILKQMPEKRWP